VTAVCQDLTIDKEPDRLLLICAGSGHENRERRYDFVLHTTSARRWS